MRFDTNSKSARRENYEQFANLLGLNNRGKSASVPTFETMKNNSNNTAVASKSEKSLAMVYPVKQKWQKIYDPEIALQNGTIFEELNLPFYPTGCSKNNTNGEGCIR